MNNEQTLIHKILVIEPEAHVTYHYPTTHAGGWQVHKWGYKISKIHPHKIDALTEALENLLK